MVIGSNNLRTTLSAFLSSRLQPFSWRESHETALTGTKPVSWMPRALGFEERKRMNCTDFLSNACRELFTDYPLATTRVNHSGTKHSMVLMFGHGYDARFFILSRYCSEGRALYSLRPWPARDAEDIEIHASGVPDVAVEVVTRGVPIPRHGSLLGWACDNYITALVAVYAKYTPAAPQPYWTVMPLAGASEAVWPPFTDERFFGHWFWKHHMTQGIWSLGDLIAGNPGTVFWVNTKVILASDCCAVARDIKGPEGPVLRRGRYVYHHTLRVGKPVPSLRTLLAATGKIDLASRFQQPEHSDGKPSARAVAP